MTKPRFTISRLALIALVNVFCLLFIFEVVLRYAPISTFSMDVLNPSYEDSEAKHRTQPHPYLGYKLKPNWKSDPNAKSVTTHNSMGLRGPETTWEKPPGVTRVLCVGGSSTYGHTPSNDAATWPARLQVHLREALPERQIEVINGGASGYSSFETMINLELRLMDLDPDLVIVYHGINDARCALYGEPQRDNSHWRAVWPIFRPSPIERTLEKSMSYLIWRRYFTDHFSSRADLGFSAIVDYDPNNGNPYENYEYSDRGLQNFRRNLQSIVSVVRAHGGEPMFVTQGIDASDLDRHDSRDNQMQVMAELKEILREQGARLEVPVLEAAEQLEAEAARQLEATGEDDIFSLEVHLQDRGADFLADIIAKEILAQGLLR